MFPVFQSCERGLFSIALYNSTANKLSMNVTPFNTTMLMHKENRINK